MERKKIMAEAADAADAEFLNSFEMNWHKLTRVRISVFKRFESIQFENWSFSWERSIRSKEAVRKQLKIQRVQVLLHFCWCQQLAWSPEVPLRVHTSRALRFLKVEVVSSFWLRIFMLCFFLAESMLLLWHFYINSKLHMVPVKGQRR